MLNPGAAHRSSVSAAWCSLSGVADEHLPRSVRQSPATPAIPGCQIRRRGAMSSGARNGGGHSRQCGETRAATVIGRSKLAGAYAQAAMAPIAKADFATETVAGPSTT
jgi:hypothetical protein